MATQPTVGSVDDYLAQLPPTTRQTLEQLGTLILELVPDAQETISYGIPAFDLNGRHVVFIAGYARHVSLYPLPHDLAAFEAELRPYKKGKGSVQFPLGKPLPINLIRRLVTAMAGERGNNSRG